MDDDWIFFLIQYERLSWMSSSNGVFEIQGRTNFFFKRPRRAASLYQTDTSVQQDNMYSGGTVVGI